MLESKPASNWQLHWLEAVWVHVRLSMASCPLLSYQPSSLGLGWWISWMTAAVMLQQWCRSRLLFDITIGYFGCILLSLSLFMILNPKSSSVKKPMNIHNLFRPTLLAMGTIHCNIAQQRKRGKRYRTTRKSADIIYWSYASRFSIKKRKWAHLRCQPLNTLFFHVAETRENMSLHPQTWYLSHSEMGGLDNCRLERLCKNDIELSPITPLALEFEFCRLETGNTILSPARCLGICFVDTNGVRARRGALGTGLHQQGAPNGPSC